METRCTKEELGFSNVSLNINYRIKIE
jgi:hypothetical protein